MSIGTPVQLGATQAASGATTLVLTTTASSPAGSTIIVLAATSGNISVSSVSDSAGNTYVAGTSANISGGGRLRPFFAQAASALGSGGTITVTYGAISGQKLVSAISVSDVAYGDLEGAGTSATGTTPSISTGTLTQAAELVIGMTLVLGGSGDTFTEASGFTSLTGAGGGAALRWAYQIVSSTSSVTYAPTLGTSRSYVANTKTFLAGEVATVASASGSSTAAGVGAAAAASVATASGSSTASAVGVAARQAVGTANGAGTASGVGAAIAQSVGSATGSSSASGVGQALAASVASASGSSTAPAVGAATAQAVATASGSSTATASGIAAAQAVASATGASTASGVGAALAASVASAAGASTATATGAAIAKSVGTAAGTSTAFGRSIIPLTLPPTELGQAIATSPSSTLALTLATTVPIGALVFVVLAVSNNGTIPATITDSRGNTYVRLGVTTPPGSGPKAAAFYSFANVALQVGDRITPAWSDMHATMLGASFVTGLVSFQQEVQTSGSTLTVYLPTGVLSQNNTVAFQYLFEVGGASDTGYTEDGNVTPDGLIQNGDALWWSWQQPASRTPVVYGPSLGANAPWGAMVAVFNAVATKGSARRVTTRMRGLAGTAPVKPPIVWGLIGDVKTYPTAILNTAHLIGATKFRYFLGLNGPAGQFIAATAAINAAGLGQILTMGYNITGVGDGPPPDIPTYQPLIASRLDLLAPGNNAYMISGSNEADSPGSFAPCISPFVMASPTQIADPTQFPTIATATAQTLIAMMAGMVQVCKSTGPYAGQGRNFAVAAGSISTTGLIRARWYYLWTLPNGAGRAAADRFTVATTRGVGGLIANDLPNSANPNRPMFANNPTALLHMLTAYAMITGVSGQAFAQTGADYFDVHCFWNTPDIECMQEAMAWARSATGMTLISLASGQKDTNPLTSTAVTYLPVTLGMPIFTWFSSSSAHRATTLGDDVTGALSVRGTAVAGVIAANP